MLNAVISLVLALSPNRLARCIFTGSFCVHRAMSSYASEGIKSQGPQPTNKHKKKTSKYLQLHLQTTTSSSNYNFILQTITTLTTTAAFKTTTTTINPWFLQHHTLPRPMSPRRTSLCSSLEAVPQVSTPPSSCPSSMSPSVLWNETWKSGTSHTSTLSHTRPFHKYPKATNVFPSLC